MHRPMPVDVGCMAREVAALLEKIVISTGYLSLC